MAHPVVARPAADRHLPAAVCHLPVAVCHLPAVDRPADHQAGPLIFMISRLLMMRPGGDPIRFRPDLKGPTSLALSNKTAPEFRLIP